MPDIKQSKKQKYKCPFCGKEKKAPELICKCEVAGKMSDEERAYWDGES